MARSNHDDSLLCKKTRRTTAQESIRGTLLELEYQTAKSKEDLGEQGQMPHFICFLFRFQKIELLSVC
jgi:hypothetical protein